VLSLTLFVRLYRSAWLVLLKEREEVRAVEEEARVEAAAAISEMAWRPM
jgi:hypothetical protein